MKLHGLIKKYARDERLQRIVRYTVVGALTTLVSFGSFWLLNHTGIETNLSNIISIFLAVCFAYVTNKIFVFRSRCKNIGELSKEACAFFAARGFSMLVEIFGVFLLYSVIGIHELISKAVAGFIVLVLNYLFSSILFRKGKETK